MRGVIDDAAVGRLQAFAWTPNSLIVVDSAVSEPAAALTFAEIVADHRGTVVVAGDCLTFCANYVFLAAARKFVLDDGLVGFSGALTSMEAFSLRRDALAVVPQAPSEDLKRADALFLKRQDAFYARIGVQPAITFYVPNGITTIDAARQFWVYGEETLRQYGAAKLLFYPSPDDRSRFARHHCKHVNADAWVCSL